MAYAALPLQRCPSLLSKHHFGASGATGGTRYPPQIVFTSYRLPQNFFEKLQTGDLTSRISKDTADLQDLVEGLLIIGVRSIPTILGILAVSFTMDWIYALTFLLVISIIYWANLLFTRRTRDAVRRQRSVEGAMASDVQEALSYHKAVAALCLEEDVLEDFEEAGQKSALHGVAAGRFQGMLTASMDLLVGATTLFPAEREAKYNVPWPRW